jgi:galactokinase
VHDFARALATDDREAAGDLLLASHRSLSEDHEVSTAGIDKLVDHLASTDGVFGARLTGGGFGGCVIALAEPGVLDLGWSVLASIGATVELL